MSSSSVTGGWGEGLCWLLLGVFSCCLAGPFVSIMTWPRKVSRPIQETLRVILPDDGRFPPIGGLGGKGSLKSTSPPANLSGVSFNHVEN